MLSGMWSETGFMIPYREESVLTRLSMNISLLWAGIITLMLAFFVCERPRSAGTVNWMIDLDTQSVESF